MEDVYGNIYEEESDNGNVSYRKVKKAIKRIGSMATIPERKESSFQIAAESFMRGLHEFSYWDGTDDFGDANKFRGVIDKEGYLFVADDDIFYPKDYKEFMIKKIEQYNRKAVITLHGKIIREQPIESFYDRRAFFKHRCMDTVKKDTPVHIPGTGVMGWHSDTISFSMDDFKAPNMADIWAGIKCEEENVPRICVAHQNDFLAGLNTNGYNCYEANRNRDHILTKAINSITWSEL